MQKQFKNYLVFIILIVVLVVPSFALAAWWNPFSWGIWNRVFHFQKTQQEAQKVDTNNWKTYNKYGIYFKYPEELGLVDDHVFNGTDGTINFSKNSSSYYIDFGIAYNNTTQPFDKFVEASRSGLLEITDHENIIVSGKKAIKFVSIVKTTGGKQADVWIALNSNKVLLVSNYIKSSDKNFDNFDLIVSTLKLTTPIVATDNDCIKSNDVNYYETYRCGDIILSYEKNPQLQCSRCVTAYLSNGTKKTELIRQVSVDCCGGGVPEFQKTSEEKIISLYTSSGDLGAASHENYYINIDTRKVLGISWYSNSEDSGITIYKDVNDKNNITFEIKALTENHCKEKNYAVLKDLMINGIPQNVIKQPVTLLCSPQFTGNLPEFPLLDLKDVGIAKDLSKVFFTVSETDWKDGVGEIPIFKYNYSFNLTSKIIVEENPENLLKIVN